ncbi:hypothetical protein I3000191B1_35640 [Flavonifractor plautii]
MGTRPYVSAFDEAPPTGHAPCRGGPRGRPPKPGGGTQMTWAVGGDKPRPYVSAFDEGPPIGHAPCRGGPCGRPPKPGGGTQMTRAGTSPAPTCQRLTRGSAHRPCAL